MQELVALLPSKEVGQEEDHQQGKSAEESRLSHPHAIYEEIDQRQYDSKRQRDKRYPCPCVNTHEIDQGMVPGDEEHLRFRRDAIDGF